MGLSDGNHCAREASGSTQGSLLKASWRLGVEGLGFREVAASAGGARQAKPPHHEEINR